MRYARYAWWIVRGVVGADIGLIIGSIGGHPALVAMGGVLGFALGLGFPDKQQRVIGWHYLNSTLVEDDAPKKDALSIGRQSP